MKVSRLLGVFFAVAAVSWTVRAGAEVLEDESPSLNTPRSALTWFLENARVGRHGESAQVLGQVEAAFPTEPSPSPALLARQLKAVLDTHVWFDLDTISDAPEGKQNDRLPADLDEVGRIPVPGGWAPVRMQRLPSGQWVFTSATVAKTPEWYAALPDRWVRDHLPEPLLRPGPKELLWWQWIAVPILFILAFVAGRVLAMLLRPVLRVLARRSHSTFASTVVERVHGPLALFIGGVVVLFLVHRLALTAPARAFLDSFVHALMLVAFFWAGLRTIDIGGDAFRSSRIVEQRPELLGLLPVGTRVAKVALLAFALVAVLQQMGYPVASLIAGLGIGGLAVALAAQKTVENLFGSVTLGVDQPFRQGDFVKVDDLVGTVEEVGLRSTRIRTLDRTLVTLPNGRLADSRIESFAARDRCRMFAVIGLVYSTRSEQIQRIREEILDHLTNHERVWPDTIRVVFTGFNQSSLDLEILAWFQTTDWGQFLHIRQDVLLKVMEIVERNGSAFALPSRTLHFAGPKPSPFPADEARDENPEAA